MKISKILLILGCLIIPFGIIFHFQGHGNIGPEASFMYKNPDWVDYGFVISIIGVILIGIGTIFKIKN